MIVLSSSLLFSLWSGKRCLDVAPQHEAALSLSESKDALPSPPSEPRTDLLLLRPNKRRYRRIGGSDDVSARGGTDGRLLTPA